MRHKDFAQAFLPNPELGAGHRDTPDSGTQLLQPPGNSGLCHVGIALHQQNLRCRPGGERQQVERGDVGTQAGAERETQNLLRAAIRAATGA